MDISLEARVECVDGLGGRTSCVIINPVTWQLTHLVVDEKQTPYLKRLVPLELVLFSSPGELFLTCTKSQLAALRPLVEIQDSRGDGLHVRYAAIVANNWPQDNDGDLPIPAKLERLDPAALKIHSNNRVKATDGRLGKVSQFMADLETKKITALVVRWKSWWRINEASVLASQIDHFEPDQVFLKLDKQVLESAAVVQLQNPVYSSSER